MATIRGKIPPTQIPSGYRTVPIFGRDSDNLLRLCVVVRVDPDPTTGYFVLLRDDIEVSVYLACLQDVGGYVHEWLELWVQNLTNFQNALRSYREFYSNHVLDERWKRRLAILSRIDRASKIEWLAEASHPLPIFFDLSATQTVPAIDPDSKMPWELCLQDALLEKHGLPRYSTTLSRYLTIRDKNSAPFVPAQPDCPRNEYTFEKTAVFGNLIPLNPDGSMMMLRKFAPLSLLEYNALLSGQAWKGIEEGKRVFKFPGQYRTLQKIEDVQQGSGHLFMAQRGIGGRLVETFYLKLNLVLQTFRLVRDFMQEEQLPFLNLTPDSFRVSLADSSGSLPYLWTSKVTITKPGAAFALPLANTDAQYFLTPGEDEMSIYRAVTASGTISGEGTVVIREIQPEANGGLVIIGTISTQERLRLSPSDLISFRLPRVGDGVDLYANLIDGQTQGLLRFRTFPQRFSEATDLAIRATNGVRFQRVLFETLPLKSSPCDLYSLAVIAVELLLVNEENSLSVALDELFNLAETLSARAREEESFSLRALAESDPRWRQALGPQRLFKAADAITPEEAGAYLPGELWWDTLEVLINCIPGASPQSYCSSLSDVRPLALQTVLDPAILALEKLLVCARSLLFVDWKYNAEINSIVRSALRRHLAETSERHR